MAASPLEVLLALVSPTPVVPETTLATDWRALYRLADQHALAPLLHARLAPILDTLPAEVQRALRRAHTESAAQTLFLEWELAQLVGAFRDAHLPLVIFKGIPLARQLFGDPALRPMIDLDVLVHEADLEASCRLLASMGWTLRASEFLEKNYDFIKEVGGGSVLLELHWSNQRRGEYDLPEAQLWRETVETPEGRLFTREMTLLSLALHTARHSFRPYRHQVDIAHALAQWGPTLDWARVTALARAAHALPMLATVLAIVHRDLGTPLPPHAGLQRLIRSPRIRFTAWLLSRQRLLGQPSFSKIDRYGIPLTSGAWRPATFFVRDLLRTPKQMAAIYHLPENSPLILLFYLLRPFLLTGKYLRRRLSQ